MLNVTSLLAQTATGDPEEDQVEWPAFDAAWNRAFDKLSSGDGSRDAMQDVVDRGIDLFQIGKHVGVAVKLTLAETMLDGFAGLANGLELITGLVQQDWDGALFPELDTDDDPPDPRMRVNQLANLCDMQVLGLVLRGVMLFKTSRGPRSVREAFAAEGLLGTSSITVDADALRADAQSAASEDPDAVKATAAAISRARQLTQTLQHDIEQRCQSIPSSSLPTLDVLVKWLDTSGRVLAPDGLDVLLGGGSVASNAAGDVADDAATMAPASGSLHRKSGTVLVGVGTVESRNDAKQVIAELATWFEKNEATSPVREMLLYAKDLVDMNFFQLQDELQSAGELQAKLRKYRVSGESPAGEGAG